MIMPFMTNRSLLCSRFEFAIGAYEKGQRWKQSVGLLAVMQQFAVLTRTVFPTMPPSVLVRWAGKGGRPRVFGR